MNYDVRFYRTLLIRRLPAMVLIGAAFSMSALIASAFDADGVALVLVGVLAGFAFLEAAAGFCAGCWVFRALMRTGLVTESTCEACNDIWSPTGV